MSSKKKKARKKNNIAANRQASAARRAKRKSIKGDPRRIRTLQNKLQDVYNTVNLETTCCRQCVCCSVACPQMNYSEAVQIIDVVWANWETEEKRQLLMTSINYFFSNSMIKPCPLLDNESDTGGCRVYGDRPLNCRLYGQWPQDVYEQRVETFEKATGFERKQLPLNTQCQHVKRVDGEDLSEETINGLFAMVDNIDRQIGDFSDAQMDQRYNYRPIHDWLLAKFWGEEALVFWTEVFRAMTKEEIADLVEKLHNQVEQMDI